MNDYPDLCENCMIGQLHFLAKTKVPATKEQAEHSSVLLNCLFCDSLLKLENGLLSLVRQGMLYRKRGNISA